MFVENKKGIWKFRQEMRRTVMGEATMNSILSFRKFLDLAGVRGPLCMENSQTKLINCNHIKFNFFKK